MEDTVQAFQAHRDDRNVEPGGDHCRPWQERSDAPVTRAAPLWEDQAAAARAFIGQAPVTPDEYIFLLHLLLPLGAGPADCPRTVESLSTMPSASPGLDGS